jgi:uncharacterized membrane protein YkvA (DUF1232 family)
MVVIDKIMLSVVSKHQITRRLVEGVCAMHSSITTVIERWRQWTRTLKDETYTLYLAYRDPRTPWFAKVFAVLVVAYAFSPIDLVPDFIPVLGYLDDLLLIPLGVLLARKMIPDQVMAECRAQAQSATQAGKPVNWVAAAVIVAIWVGLAILAVVWLIDLLR